MAKSDSKRAQFGSRHLDEKRDVFAENAWFVLDDFEWSEQLSDFARLKIEQNSKCFVDECEKNRFEREANTFWDKFYEKHQNNFFKDRHWLSTEFPELFAFDSEQKVQILELGSGVGNTVFPLLQMNSVVNWDNFKGLVKIVPNGY
ncbi:methyltransferase-like protein 7 [Dinothrombium tinctorium]|uniref:Methyltransferase-like protein 7 n=1 Tax=Dinothrombium tinctorium TaxID=1965070 RepID=A0A443RBK4_9ACAR|nr:methyltransferase-like protein 7 [Dinothrombium tinctorium]